MSELLHDILKGMESSQQKEPKEAAKEPEGEGQSPETPEGIPKIPDDDYVMNMPREYYLNHIAPRFEEFGLPKNAKPVDFVNKLIIDKMQNKQTEVQPKDAQKKEEEKEEEKEESDIVKVTKLIQSLTKPISEQHEPKWYIKYKWVLILLLGVIVVYLLYRFLKNFKNKPIAKAAVTTNVNTTNANTNTSTTNGDWCSQTNK